MNKTPEKFVLHAAGTSPFRDVPLALTGMPKEEAGLPVHYLRKEVIPIGVTRNHPDEGYPIHVTPERAAKWVEAFKLMRDRGHGVPAPPAHRDDKNSYGKWIDLSIERNERGALSVFGVLKVVGDQMRESVVNKDVSICTVRGLKDDSNNVYEEAAEHIAVTPYAALTGLSGWTSIAASRGPAVDRVPVFELAASTKESIMDLTALRKAVGAADTVTDADVITQAATKLGTIPALETAKATAESERDTVKVELSRRPAANEGEFPAAIAAGSVNNLHGRIELMAERGTVSAEQATAAKALIGTPDKPNTLNLSRTGADHPAEKWLEVLALGKGNVTPDGKSKTGVQELSRQRHTTSVNGDEPTEEEMRKDGEARGKRMNGAA